MKISDLYVHSSSSVPPLRVGLLLDDVVLERLFAEVVRDIRRSNFAELKLLVLNRAERPAAKQPRPRSFAGRVWRVIRDPQLRRALGWDLYTQLDQRCFTTEDDPLALEDGRELLAGVETLHVTPITKRFAHHFPEEAVAAVRAKDLHVLLRFGFNILRGDILKAARYGVWSFHYGDNDYYRGRPAHFWEMVEGNPLSGVVLQMLTEELDAGQVLAKGLFATQPGISLIRNRIQPYWSSEHMVIQKLWEVREYGWERVKSGILPAAPYQGKKKIYRTPANREIVRWLLPQLATEAAGRAYRMLRRADHVAHWRIAIRAGKPPAGGAPLAMDGFRWMESPRGHFYADPFLFEKDGRRHLFLEDLVYKENRGVIAHAEISSAGEVGEVRTVLDTGAHASYPCVFADGGDVYMIPETLEDCSVRLFRARRFPEEWEEAAQLFRGPAVDTSVWKQDGLWWFFTTLQEPRGRGMALFLFWSETLTGRWQYHPRNPISFDVRRARGAGNIFRHGEMLIRPSQDCSGRYGRAFALNRIVKLTREEYEEELLHVVEPRWAPGLLATHTYNRLGDLEVTDGRCLCPRATVW